MPNEWFEGHSDDPDTDKHFQIESEGDLDYDFHATIEEAREAARVAREDHPTTRIWIVRLVEEWVEDVPVTPPPPV